MIPSVELSGVKSQVASIVDYADTENDEIERQADKVKSEIEKLEDLLEEEDK